MLGDGVTDRRVAAVEFSRLRDGRAISIEGLAELGTDVSRAGATPETLVAPVVAVILLALRFEDDRCRRAVVGTMPLYSFADVDEVVEATEAVCCRSRESSRVKRLTCHKNKRMRIGSLILCRLRTYHSLLLLLKFQV